MPHYFYIARCSDDSLYSGTCIDVADREATHNSGKGAKYTRSRRPIQIIYTETYQTLPEARRREAAIKKWSREEKQLLLEPAGGVPVKQLRNLGTACEQRLHALGIYTRADLERLGPVRVYQMCREAGFRTSIILLWALTGALMDIPWNELPASIKEQLETELEKG